MNPSDPKQSGIPLLDFLHQGSPLQLRLRGNRLVVIERFIPSIPTTGQLLATRPDPATGLGFICARVTFGSSEFLPLEVKALVYPAMHYPQAITINPPSVAVTGIASAGGMVWNYNGTQEVPGVAHTPAGAPNRMAVWTRDDTGWDFDGSVSFLARTGGSGPCGTPGSPSTGSSSSTGSGSSSFTGPRGRIYPAVWCVAASGFPGEHLGAFNATWALRQSAGATTPAWDNGGDGKLAVRVTLTLDAKQGWILTFALHALHVSYTLPFQDNAFGPLRFAKKRAKVGGAGTVSLPAVDVSAL